MANEPKTKEPTATLSPCCRDDQLPRELMESCLAVSQEATFAGFDTSVIKEVFSEPKSRRLFELVYRMGFECGWRIREQQGAPPRSGPGQPTCDNCPDMDRTGHCKAGRCEAIDGVPPSDGGQQP